RTERLLLRPVTLRDAGPLACALNDYEVTKTTGTLPFPLTADHMRFRVRNWIKCQGDTQFGLLILHQGAVVGHMGIGHIAGDRWNIGYSITRSLWGRGLVTEAVHAFCDFAFRVLKIGVIEADAFVDNPGSLRVAEKCGFQSRGVIGEGWSTTRQAHFPVIGFELTRERFLSHAA
ncbi:MAG: GNAT family N-acetyltransferase, partial [Pseudomonadota bacterium]